MASDAFAQAQVLLEELIDAAKAGTIIPIRLPGQLEALQELIEQARKTSAAPPAAAPTGAASPADTPAAAAPPGADQTAFLKEQSAFVSHAVHELRTPLTSIRGYADMLRLGQLDEMQKNFVETIRTNSRRMESLLTDVSDTAKLKGGVLRTSIKVDMFKNIALMVEKQAQPLADELGRTLTFDIQQGLPILNVDGELLAKALYKLVENGLRYSGQSAEGAVVVRGLGSEGKLIVTVTDNGIGMTPEELDQLGTIYFRAENDYVRSYKGSGLGITIAYGIIHLLGGSITVASSPGAGTTFTITLAGMS